MNKSVLASLIVLGLANSAFAADAPTSPAPAVVGSMPVAPTPDELMKQQEAWQKQQAERQQSIMNKRAEHQKAMSEYMEKLQNTTDPEQRQALIQEHMQMMQKNMAEMRSLMMQNSMATEPVPYAPAYPDAPAYNMPAYSPYAYARPSFAPYPYYPAPYAAAPDMSAPSMPATPACGGMGRGNGMNMQAMQQHRANMEARLESIEALLKTLVEKQAK